jgi:hypothetical protein
MLPDAGKQHSMGMAIDGKVLEILHHLVCPTFIDFTGQQVTPDGNISQPL